MKEALEIVKTFISPIEKLIDTVSAGTGILYEPIRKKRLADAAAHEIEVIGKALRNNSDIIVTYDNGKVTADTPELNDFVKRTQYRLTCQELYKQYNIESVIQNAYEELEKETVVSSEPVDTDWVNRFFYCVGDISNQEMQKLWGKILAGEIKQPGSFSKRTLNMICNLSQAEANAFQKIIPAILCTGKERVILSNSDIRDKYGIRFGEIMLLDECGLVTSNGLVSLDISLEPKKEETIYNSKLLMKIVNTSDTVCKFSLGVHALTNAGLELLRVLELNSKSDCIKDAANEIFKENSSQLEISLHEIKSANLNDITYKTKPNEILKK